MLYGDNKRRTMLRSILPSSARKSAREDKRAAHKGERARTRDALGHIWDYESALDCERDVLYDADEHVKEVMWDRRGADKVNHFVHWAERITDHIEEPFDRFDYMRSIVPDNLIGRHALTHLPFEWDRDRPPRIYYGLPKRDVEKDKAEYLALAAALYEVCAQRGLQKRFNDLLKSNFVGGHQVWNGRIGGKTQYRTEYCENCAVGARVLGGIGDIELWIADWHDRDLFTHWKVIHDAGYGIMSMQRDHRLYALRHHGEVWARAVAFLVAEDLLDERHARRLGLRRPGE